MDVIFVQREQVRPTTKKYARCCSQLKSIEEFIIDGVESPICEACLVRKGSRYVEGTIYIISDGYGNYKIGKTEDFINRVKVLKIYIPYLSVVYVQVLKGCDYVEQVLHRKYKYKHISGEWYLLNEEDISEIIGFLSRWKPFI